MDDSDRLNQLKDAYNEYKDIDEKKLMEKAKAKLLAD